MGTLTRLESREALDRLRHEAAHSLNTVCGLLERKRLTQEALERAGRAIEAWLNELNSQRT